MQTHYAVLRSNPRIGRLLAVCVLLLAGMSAAWAGHEFAVCTALIGDRNPSHQGIMTTRTQLRCEMPRGARNGLWTAPQLMDDGWVILNVVGGNPALVQGKRAPQPLYYFERWDGVDDEEEEENRSFFGNSRGRPGSRR